MVGEQVSFNTFRCSVGTPLLPKNKVLDLFYSCLIGNIMRQPKTPRSIELLVDPTQLPDLL